MSRDYAKKLPNSQRRSGFKLVISILLAISIIAVIIALIFVVCRCHEKHEKKATEKASVRAVSIAPVKAPPLSPIPIKSESQFKFYTLLPKMKVTTPLPFLKHLL